MSRVIVYGVGAVGGVVAASLARVGREVIGIARGRRLAAIQERGIMLRTPHFAEYIPVPCVADPSEIDFREGDMMMLAMKTQDTPAALDRLRAAGWTYGPIYCAQNGVTNEDLTLRVFPNVHGILVMLPCTFSDMDEAVTFSTPRHGVFEVGRYPGGIADDDRRMAEALEAGNIGGFPAEDVMAAKYGKLIINLVNIIQAAVGVGATKNAAPIREMANFEAKAALAAAGITWRDVGGSDPRRDELMKQVEVPGVVTVGGSTSQSLARGAGSVETDYLNGEISRLGRLHGVPTPVNDCLNRLGDQLARGGAAPGSMSVEALKGLLRETEAGV